MMMGDVDDDEAATSQTKRTTTPVTDTPGNQSERLNHQRNIPHDTKENSDVSEHEEEDEMEDEEDDVLEAQDEATRLKAYKKRARHAITGRGATLKMLMDDKIMEAGDGLISIDYLGMKFTANLLKNGKIFWPEEKKTFNSPSAFAIFCKKSVNPSKKSGCGWASVKYKGKKLDVYKSKWFLKHRSEHLKKSAPQGSVNKAGGIFNDSGIRKPSVYNKQETKQAGAMTSPVDTLGSNEGFADIDNSRAGSKTSQLLSPKSKGDGRLPIKHTLLNKKSEKKLEKNTLVESITFNSQGKIQPFTISISSNCLLVMDFHSHLTAGEVMGYLAGKWESQTQHIYIYQAFPCKVCQCTAKGSKQATAVEKEIRDAIYSQGMTVVGWYHSHPRCRAEPSIQDTEAQLSHQISLKGAGRAYNPCVGVIVAPYDNDNSSAPNVSRIKAFWVAPPVNFDEYGIPMSMMYSISQDMFISEEIIERLKKMIKFYRKGKNLLDFEGKLMADSTTLLNKLKVSTAKKFPRNPADSRYIERLYDILCCDEDTSRHQLQYDTNTAFPF